MDIITLEHVKKSFDGQEILKDFNLSVMEGVFRKELSFLNRKIKILK